ncbi:phage tail tape measure protein [Clostridium gasigenes]|uniref:Phage tail tape measure protein n=2 Tax=Clostridium gasigenes TaxID=94869 RepID=A0A7X0SEX2_9CLOT|nr:phage tail tape measure protein [Clostridium gasigenes]MBB6716275.1 phage tail tape measure protein [Clostridium gasigenes]
MDKSVYAAVSNIEKSYKLWENASNASGKSLEDNSKKIELYKSSMKLLDDEIKKSEKTLSDIEKQCGKNSKEYENFKSHVLDLKIKHSELSKELEKVSKTTYTVAENMERLDESYKKTSVQMSNIEKSYKLFNLTQEKTGKGIFDNSNKIDSLKGEMNLLEGTIKKHESLLKAVEKEYGKNSKQAEEYKSKVLDLKIAHVELGKDLKVVTKETTTLAGKLDILGKEFSKIDDKYRAFDKIGNSLTNVGSKLTMGVTVPLIGLGVASTKLFGDFEHGTAKISTIADTSKLSMDKISEGVKNLSTTTGVSTNDLNEALYETLSAGVDTSRSIDFLDVAVKAAKGGFTNTATAVDGLTTVLNSYGLTADKANDIANQMLITQNLGKTTFGELASAVGKVTPVSAALGITTNELFSSLASTTSQGLATSESVTALKAAMSNIIKPTKEAGEAAQSLGIDFSVSSLQSKGWIGFLGDLKTGLQKASPEFDKLSVTFGNNAMKMLELEKAGKKTSAEYKNLQKENKNLNKELELLAQASDSPIGAMATMFGSVEGLNSILMLTSDQGMKIYDDSMKQMTENTGALDDAYKKMSNTSTEKFTIQLNKLKLAGIEAGNKLMPLVEKGVKLLGDLAESFSKASPATQEWIVKIGLASVALGPLMLGLGGTFKGIGDLLSTGKKVGTFFGLFKAAPAVAGSIIEVGTATTVTTGAMATLGTVALPVTLAIAGIAGAVALYNVNSNELKEKSTASAESMGSLETAMAGLNGQVIHSNSDLEKMNVNYKNWNEKVSPETQATLEVTAKRIADYSLELKHAEKIDKLVDSESCKKLVDGINGICDSAIAKIKGRTPEIQKTLADGFNADGVLTEDEKKILDSLNKSGEDQIKKINEIKAKILELEKRAGTEQGNVRKNTYEEVAKLTKEIGNIELQNTVNSKEELMNATAEFNTRMNNLDMTNLSGLLAEKATARDAENTKQTEYYDKQINMLKLNFDNVDADTKVAYTAQIAALDKQKTDSIAKEDEKYNGYLVSAQEKYPLLQNYINGQNGELLTKAEQQKQFELDTYAGKMDNMLGITKTGYYQIKNNVSGNMHDTYVEVDGTTGQIKGVWDKTTGQIMGNPIKAKEEIAEELKNGQAFQPIATSYDEKKQEIANNRIEVYTEEKDGLFDWVGRAYNSMQNLINDHPLIASAISGGALKPTAIPGHATGTDYFKGGLTWIDEEGSELIELPGSGPKLVDLPRGAKIYNNSKSNSMKEQMMGSKSPKATAELFPRKVDFLNLAQPTGSFDLMSDEQKKNLDTIKNKYDKLNSLSDLGSIGLGTKTNSQAEELAKMSIAIAKQVEKLEILKSEYKETKSLLGGNSKEVIGLEKNMTSLTVEIENNKKSLEQSQIKNNFKATYDEIELALIKLSGKTGSFSEEISKQEKIYALNLIKLNSMQEEYSQLSKVIGESSDEVKQLEKSIINLNIELENSAEKLREDMINNINTFDNKLIQALKNRYDNEEKLQEDSINNELQSLDKWKDESIKIINDVYDAKIKAIEDSSIAETTALEDEINALDESEKQKDRTETDTKELSKIDNLKDAIGFEHNDFNKAEMQKELNNFIKDREKRLHKESLEDRKEVLKKQIDLIKENAKKQKEQLELDKQQEIKNNEELYKNNKDTLNKKIEGIKKFYADKTKLANLQAKAEKLIMDNNQKEIVELLKSYSPQYEESGKTLGEKMADGFKEKMKSAISMIGNIESRINSLRDIDMQNALASVNYVPSLIENNVGSTTTSSSVVNNKNNIVFNSPKALTPSETQRQTETTLRRIGFAL